ncbi:MAG: hypothetical protein O3A64_02345 [Proteobacteria bacterium]|nr:hypothetical protein [Pseudomonadota bacterium]
MKQYRIQIRSDGLYYNGIVNAENDAEALIQFKNKLENGEIEAKGEGLYIKNKIFITYEELKNGTTKVDIGETSIGVQMGNSGVATG